MVLYDIVIVVRGNAPERKREMIARILRGYLNIEHFDAQLKSKPCLICVYPDQDKKSRMNCMRI